MRPGHSVPGAGDGVGDGGAGEVVVLDQHGVGEPQAVVGAAAGADGGLLEEAEAGEGLARIEDADPGVGLVGRLDEAGREGGDAGEVAEEVQRSALGGEDRAQGPADIEDGVAGFELVTVVCVPFEVEGGADAAEGLVRAGAAGEDAAWRGPGAHSAPVAVSGTSAAVRSPSGPRSSASARSPRL